VSVETNSINDDVGGNVSDVDVRLPLDGADVASIDRSRRTHVRITGQREDVFLRASTERRRVCSRISGKMLARPITTGHCIRYRAWAAQPGLWGNVPPLL